MRKRLVLFTLCTFLFTTFFFNLTYIIEPPDTVFASYFQDNNNGAWTINFSNNAGIKQQQDIVADYLAETITVAAIDSGYVRVGDITPASFKNWGEVQVIGSWNDDADVLVSLYDCASPTPNAIGDNSNYQNQQLAGGILDISGLDPNANTCIQVRVDLDDSDNLVPVVNEVRVTWAPLPVLLVNLDGDNLVQAGNNIVYNLLYSLSYSNDTQVIAWIPMPTPAAGSYNPGYGQAVTMDGGNVASISNGGEYTSVGVTVNGVSIPANSIYWDLGNISSGTTDTLTVKLQTKNGLEDGIQYEAQAHIDALLADEVMSDANDAVPGDQPYITELNASPSPLFEKKSQGTISIQNKDYIYSGGGYTAIVTYPILLTNQYAPTGRETIFNPVIEDDLTDILNQLNASCGVDTSNPAILSSLISPQQVYGTYDPTVDPNTITWIIPGHLAPGTIEQVSFSVDYSDCITAGADTTITNVATARADNISSSNASKQVETLLDQTARGTFAKGDKVSGQSQINGNRDDNPTALQNYTSVFSYLLRATNSGAVRIDDWVIFDKVPSGEEFVSATMPPNVNGAIYYATTVAYGDPLVAPPFDYTLIPAPGADWSSSMPADPTDVTWVAYYVPCLSSSYFPSPAGSQCDGVPSAFTAELQVRILEPGPTHPFENDTCAEFDMENIGLFNAYEAAPNITSQADGDISALATPIEVTDRDEFTHATPALGDYSTSSSISGPSVIEAMQSGIYTINVVNNGTDIVHNAQATIDIPKVNVNGSLAYLDYVGFSGAPNTKTYDVGDVSRITADLGTMNAGASYTLTLTLGVPRGVKNNDSFSVIADLSGADDDGCKSISASLSQGTTLSSNNSLQIYKRKDESIINTGEKIHYQLEYSNTGTSPSTGTYLVDAIPEKTVLDEAYTFGINLDGNGNDFTCNGCTAYFSKEIPLGPNELLEFDSTVINANFSLGQQSAPGIWEPPAGMTKEEVAFIAWLVDDPSLGGGILPTGSTGQVGFTATNDDDGGGPGVIGSSEGTMIYNSGSIFSDQLLQAVGNQVITLVLPDPGLIMEKSSSMEHVYSGEEFDWNVVYRNDTTNDDTSVSLTDTLPYGTVLVGAFHEWNDFAVNVSGLPAGETSIMSSSNFSASANPDGTTTITVDVAQGLRGGNLQGNEGGTLRLRVRTETGLQTDVRLENTVQGCYANAQGSFCSNTTDEVVIKNPDLWLRKSVDRLDPLAGENVTYTLIVSNEGIRDATNVVITDTLPAGLCYAGPLNLIPTDWNLGAPSITLTSNGAAAVGVECETQSTTLTWSAGTGNELNHPSYTSGTIPGNSVNINIEYTVNVAAIVSAGTDLSNTAEITTPLTEDTNYPNTDSQNVATPLPDPYVLKSSAPLRTILPGETFDYLVSYGNNNREAAQGVYLIDLLPDINGDGLTDITFVSTIGNQNEQFWFYDANTASAPLNGLDTYYGYNFAADADWKSLGDFSPPAEYPTHMAIVDVGVTNGSLGEREGPNQIVITAQAANPYTSANLSAGLTIENTARIYSSSLDVESSNNEAVHTNITPQMDLAIEKNGSPEGSFPGIEPGSNISYTITYKNSGTVDACQVWVQENLPTELENMTYNFGVIQLTDTLGNPINPIDLTGNDITTPVNTTFIDNGNGTYTWQLGSAASTPYDQVCLPPGAQGTFQVFAQLKAETADEHVVTNTAIIGEDSAGAEDNLANNQDTSTVTAYRAGLVSSKEGISCGVDNICGNGDDNYTDVNPGETIEYTVEYNNLGNMDAQDSIITETIPEGTCYTIGTVEAAQPAATILEYSNDNGVTWNYTPVDSGDGTDCSTTNFRLRFVAPLPAPATFYGEGDAATFVGTYDPSKLQVADEIELLCGGSSDISKEVPIAQTQTGGDASPHDSSMHFDSNGNAHVMFQEQSAIAGEGDDVYYYNAGTGITNLLSDQAITEGNSISGVKYTVDSDDVVHAFWMEDSGTADQYDLFYYNSSTGTQRLTDQATSEGNISWNYRFKLDSTNNMHVTWSERNTASTESSDVYYFASDTGVVSRISDLALTEGDAYYIELFVDRNDDAHIYWKEYSGLAESGNQFYYNSGVGITRMISDLALTEGDVGQWNAPLIKLDGSNNSHTIWYEYSDATERNDLYYYNSTMGAGPAVRVTDPAISEGDVSTARFYVESNGTVHIAWVERNGPVEWTDVYYYTAPLGGPGTTSGVSIIAPTPSPSGDISTEGGVGEMRARLDGNGTMHIVWDESSVTPAERSNIYYYNSSSGTTKIITDLAVSEGWNNRLKALIGTDNDLHVIWSEDTGGDYDLFYYNLGNDVTMDLSDMVVVDSPAGNSGHWRVLLDSNNAFHIAWPEYADATENMDMYYYDSITNSAINISDRVATQGSINIEHHVMEIDDFNNVHLAWTERHDDLPGPVPPATNEQYDVYYYNSSTGDSDGILLTDHALSEGEAQNVGVFTGAGNQSFISWREVGGGAEGIDSFLYDSVEGVTHLISDLVATEGDAFHLSTKVTPDNKVHLSWLEMYDPALSAGETVNLFYYNDGSFDTLMLTDNSLTQGDIGVMSSGDFFSTMKFNPLGKLHVIWNEQSTIGGDGLDMFFWSSGSGDGTYETTVPSNGTLNSWDKLQVLHSTPTDTDIRYTLLDSTCTTPFAGLDDLPLVNGFANISSIPIVNTTICFRAVFSSNSQDSCSSPSLDALRVTYRVDETPSFSFRVKVRQDNLFTSTIDNTVCIDSRTSELDSENNCSSDRMNLVVAEQSILKSSDSAAAHASDTVTYTLEYQNNGPRDGVNSTITDNLPANIVGIAGITSPPTSLGQVVTCIDNGGAPYVVTCTFASSSLRSNESGTITVQAQVAASPPISNGDILTNTACIESDLFDSNTGNDCSTVNTVIGDFSNVWVTKDGPSQTHIDEDLTFTINYGSNGNLIANAVILTETVPTNTTFSGSLSSPSWSCGDGDPAGTVCTINLGNLATGTTGSHDFAVHVNNDTNLLVNHESIANTVQISTSSTQSSTLDDIANFSVPIRQASLSSISGNVFTDQNGNVVYDAGDDSYIPNAEIYFSGYDIYNGIYGPDSSDPLYDSIITVLLPDLIANGVVPPGTTVPEVATLAAYSVIPPSSTDASGDYVFNNIQPGNYNLRANIAPVGSTAGVLQLNPDGTPNMATQTGQGSQEGHGTANEIIHVQIGESEDVVMSNFSAALGTIGNSVFKDNNSNGVFDPAEGESRLNLVEVTLYEDADADGAYTAGTDTPLRSAITDSSGLYTFQGLSLDDGDGDHEYILRVTDAQNIVGTFTNTTGTGAVSPSDPAGTDYSRNGDGYGVTLSSAATSDYTADFGYYEASSGGGSTGGSIAGGRVSYDDGDDEWVETYYGQEKSDRDQCLAYVEDRQRFFTDMPKDAWYSSYFNFLKKVKIHHLDYDQFILSGYGSFEGGDGDATIGALNNLTRMEAVKIALTSNCIPIYQELPMDGPEFSDLPRERYPDDEVLDWHTRVMYTGADNDILHGYEHNGAAAPRDFATRAEALKIFLRASDIMSFMDIGYKDAGFSDVSKNAWFYDYVRFAGNNNIVVRGASENNFYPNRNIVRAEMAALDARTMYLSRRVDDFIKTIIEDLGLLISNGHIGVKLN